MDQKRVVEAKLATELTRLDRHRASTLRGITEEDIRWENKSDAIEDLRVQPPCTKRCIKSATSLQIEYGKRCTHAFAGNHLLISLATVSEKRIGCEKHISGSTVSVKMSRANYFLADLQVSGA